MYYLQPLCINRYVIFYKRYVVDSTATKTAEVAQRKFIELSGRGTVSLTHDLLNEEERLPFLNTEVHACSGCLKTR